MKKGNLNSSSSEEENDWISSLPDSLIEHILSFMDMKFAVQTCVLAKRWRYTWTFLPVLNFCDAYHSIEEDRDDDAVEPTKRFIKFVDKVLSLRDENSDIRRFDLFYSFYYRNDDEIYSCIHRWIAAAVSHNVQEICIRLTPNQDFELPLCLWTCESLTGLELELYGYEPTYEYASEFILPEGHEMSLPRLKSLRLILEYIFFVDEELTNRFFSSFPSLESLIMKVEIYQFTQMNINISLPKLKYFKFDSRVYDSNCEVKLHAPSLSSLIFRSLLSTNLILMNLSSLATADFEIRIGDEDPKIRPRRMMELLRGINKVHVLTVDHNFLEALGGPPDILQIQPSEHFNIQHLKLHAYLSRDCLRSIFFILNNSPSVEFISLQIRQAPAHPYYNEVEFDPDNIGDDWDAELSLPSRICHLKIAEIKGLRGHAIELKFLELLLKHATVLEKVVLTSYSTEQDLEREKRMTKFSETLLTFPTTSKKILILLKF